MNGHKLLWLAAALVLLMMVPMPALADSGGDTAIVGQDYFLDENESLDNGLVVVGGTAELARDSVVHGDVAVLGGEAIVDGEVLGNVVIFGGTLELLEHAIVEGDVVVFGRVRRHPEAVIEGSLIEGLEAGERLAKMPQMLRDAKPMPPEAPETPALPEARNRPDRTGGVANWFVSLGRRVVTMIAILVLAALIQAVLPDSLDNTQSVMRGSVLLSVVVGFVTLLLVAILVPILTIICIGIPVALVLLLAVLLGSLLGWAAVGGMVGRELFRLTKAKGATPMLVTIVGTLVVTLIAQVACIGPLFATIVGAWALGAVVLTRFGRGPVNHSGRRLRRQAL